MEWEIMIFCNSVGIIVLVLIAMFHIIGVEKEKNGEIIETETVKVL
jgi:hypothetical protein